MIVESPAKLAAASRWLISFSLDVEQVLQFGIVPTCPYCIIRYVPTPRLSSSM